MLAEWNLDPSHITLAILLFLALIFIFIWVLTRKLSLLLDKQSDLEQLRQHLDEQLTQLREVQIDRLANVSMKTEQSFRNIQASLGKTLVEFQSSVGNRMIDLKEALFKQQSDFQISINEKIDQNRRVMSENLADGQSIQQRNLTEFKESLLEALTQIRQSSEKLQFDLRDRLVSELRTNIKDIKDELSKTLNSNSDKVSKSMEQLTQNTDQKLKEISGQVEKRLTEGFEKTTQTFHDVLKRLALIDEAQKKITELSSNVVSLQQVLADKRSRGAFGEVQLNALIKNVLPERNYSIQHKLSNDRIVDCMLLLPEPTGKLAVDAKFPLESYQTMTDFELSDSDRQTAARQFKQDIKRHIKDINTKYIVEGETASGAVMFIPAEAVFAEIHGHFPELVELAHKEKVWMVSPTTMMAILTTASAVIKDEATRKQVHIIQQHLSFLSEDFGRFKLRMDNLSKHIGQVSKDVDQIATSATKITSRFEKIEQVDLPNELENPLID